MQILLVLKMLLLDSLSWALFECKKLRIFSSICTTKHFLTCPPALSAPLSPISESMGDSGGPGRKRAASSTNSNPRSAVSAAVSDESVAGDSGVFEAAQHRKEDLGGLAMSLETAQVQVKLRYSRQDNQNIRFWPL